MSGRTRRHCVRALLVAFALVSAACAESQSTPPASSAGRAGRGGAAAPSGGAGGHAGTAGPAGAGGGVAGASNAGSGGDGASGRAGAAGGGALPEPDVAAILEAGCATSTERSELLPSNLLFVIDRSSSMSCNPPPTTISDTCEKDPMRADPLRASKWEIMRDKLLEAIQALRDDTVVGISYFSNDDSCGVQATPNVELASLGPAQRGLIRASLGNVEPDGATPLVGAVILAYSHIHAQALEGKLRGGNKFVVLLTDGEQSEVCSDSDRCADKVSCTKLLVEQEAPKARAEGVGIRTFVIGAPGSENAREVLSQLAISGGTAPPGCNPVLGTCHFDMTTEPSFDTALASALSAIADRTLRCDLQLPQLPAGELDPKRVNVIYSPADGSPPRVVRQDQRLGCDEGANGWQYTENQTQIRLCGQACTTVAQDSGARLDVVLGCKVRGPD